MFNKLRLVYALQLLCEVFLQRFSIACYAERCISHDRFCLSDRPSHAGIMPKQLKLRSGGLH